MSTKVFKDALQEATLADLLRLALAIFMLGLSLGIVLAT